MLSLSYKGIMRIVCFFAAAILAMLGFVIWNSAEAGHLRLRLENEVVSSLGQAASGMNELNIDLTKSYYAGTPAQVAELSAKVWKTSGEVRSALEILPAGGLDSANRFLAQVGDYSMYLGRRASNGLELSSGETETVRKLMEYSEILSVNLSELERKLRDGEISVSDFVAGGGVPIGTTDIGGLEVIENNFEGYPALIYDGPFSDNLLSNAPKDTSDLPRVSRETALGIAGGFAGVEPSSLLNGGDEVSNMPSYTFYNNDVTVGVTISGGFVTYLCGSRIAGSRVLTINEGRARARDFLESRGIKSMAETYYELASGILTVNLAYRQGDVTCYTDLIRVGVAMDNGEVLFYDARGYISNHRSRNIDAPGIPPESAQKSVSKNLDVKSHKLALIPTPGKNEVLAWEFLCEGVYGEKVLVYVNAETGAEEQILILIESENGVLTV